MSRTDFNRREEIRAEARRWTVQSIADRHDLQPDTVRKIVKMQGPYERDRINPRKGHGKDVRKA